MKDKSRKARATEPLVPPAPPASSPTTLPVQVQLHYADGVGNLVISPVISRLTLVVHSGPAKDGAQPAIPSLELIIPTPALLAFIQQVHKLLTERAEGIANAYEQTGKQVAELARQLAKISQ